VSRVSVEFDGIAPALAESGYIVLHGGLPGPVGECLLELREQNLRRFYPAGIGRGQEHNRNPGLRRDRIAWIDKADSQAASWVDWTQQLRLYLNQHLFLGLFSFESHLAIYEPGDFYKTHVDAFRGQSNRRLSLVIYLNHDWQAEQGGELVLYHPQTGVELQRVLPEFGTLVLFLSEEFPHEVLPATRPRLSVAGWFRVNTPSGSLDSAA
jgi:SM-20-related protein